MKNKIILGSNPVILDIGTYDGCDSIEFLDMNNNARVFAFEADLRSIDLFKHSISSKESLQILINYYNLNPQTNIDKLFELVNSSKLTLVKKAISDMDGETTWYNSQQIPPLSEKEKERGLKSWSASSSIKKPLNHLNTFTSVEFDSPIKVESIKLDTWFKTQPDIDFIDFVWADVNGGEKELVKGGIDTFKNHVNYLYTEFSDNQMMEEQPTLNEILDILGGTFTVLDKKINGTGMYGNVLLKNINL